MRKYFQFKNLFLIVFAFTLFNCSKTEDIPQDIEINDFVWGGMNAYYKWQGIIPDLSDNKFSTREQLNSYLSGFAAPDELFNSLLSLPNEFPKDPNRVFSWITSDYIALENSFQGVRLTSGLKLVAVPYSDNSGNAYLVVRDVIAGSDADIKGITRGMIFSEVNGTQITIGNVNQLLAPTSYTLSQANYNGGNPVVNGTTFSIVETEVTENPIKIATIINEGANRIGYLMYNQFSSDFDDELNQAFADFQIGGVTDLVLDLRYNGGGSVASAVYLSSMITGQFNGEIFANKIWNEKVMANFSADNFIERFTDRIVKKDNNGNTVLDEAINSLNLTTLYIIVSEQTASASELVINSLRPYIDVRLIGTETVGKQVASITLYDSDDYTRNGPNFNASHTWAMQPIVLEIRNRDGQNEPNGFTAEVQIAEDNSNLGVLGDPSEPLLARAIQYITTGARGTGFTSTSDIEKPIWNSNMKNPDYNNMYVQFK
ncbi:S41 family peptidase [Tenacibaculum sp. MEBiC06402]|uniref:S41 family peptidase n=1 Tax=unclassified Tenacibaculum TaxID=2635139 RepID=UPI003B9C710D